MAEQRKNNATMNSKGLEKTLTDEQVGNMIARQGQTSLLIVEVTHDKYTNELDGSHRLTLIPGQIEYVTPEYENRVREFMRALYLARPDGFGQTAFDGATPDEPSIEQAAQQIDAAVEKDEDGEVTGVWDGDPDAPAPGPAAVPDAPQEDTCDFPGCLLPAEHDGDHQDTAAE